MNMNTAIARLTYALIALLLLISLVMVNVQVFQAPALEASGYNPRHCLAITEPIRGSIYDRNGIKLVESVKDKTAPCGIRRQWAPEAVKAGLAPLIGYFSYRYGASGVEAFYDQQLSGASTAAQCDVTQVDCLIAEGQNTYNKLLHKQSQGSDLYLTIDLKLQQQVNALYNQDAETGGPCQVPGSDPPGSITVEDPNTGEILAMVSRPFYDPNRIDDDTYWHQISTSTGSPLANRAAQFRYAPGSTFKTLTMAAGIDSGKVKLDTQYDKSHSLYFTVPQGQPLRWDDYFPSATSSGWQGISFPLTLQDGYAYSDNVIFARVATQLGASTWLDYTRRFGVETPGSTNNIAQFDAEMTQSRAYNAGASFNNDLLAESGFGQGQLGITPLTMAEITSTMAANGNLMVPHVMFKQVPPGVMSSSVSPQSPQLFGGGPVIQASTAAAVRQAMRAVVQYGTAAAGQAVKLANSPAIIGGKTGTAQLSLGSPHAWWISLAPAEGPTSSSLAVVVMKEHGGEGACQIFVGEDVYKCAAADHDWTPPGDLGACPAKP
jgi:cell division protein FtsI/penicillin-binding protein 2